MLNSASELHSNPTKYCFEPHEMANTYGMTPELFTPTYHELEGRASFGHDQFHEYPAKSVGSELMTIKSSFPTKRYSYDLHDGIHDYPMPITMSAQAPNYDTGYVYQASPELTNGGRSSGSSPNSPETPSQNPGLGLLLQPVYSYTSPGSFVSPYVAQSSHTTQYESTEHQIHHFGHLTPDVWLPSPASFDGKTMNQEPSPDATTWSSQHQNVAYVPDLALIGTWELQDDPRWDRQEDQNHVYHGHEQRVRDTVGWESNRPVFHRVAVDRCGDRSAFGSEFDPLVCDCGVVFTGQYVKPLDHAHHRRSKYANCVSQV